MSEVFVALRKVFCCSSSGILLAMPAVTTNLNSALADAVAARATRRLGCSDVSWMLAMPACRRCAFH